MIDNLELLTKHHIDDLRREANNERLASEILKGQHEANEAAEPKKSRRNGLLAIAANTLHIR